MDNDIQYKRFTKKLEEYDLMNTVKNSKNIYIKKPVSYLDSLSLINQASFVLTDSGGLQKEAYILGTPCITLREDTEWVETLENGWNSIVGSDKMKILQSIKDLETALEDRKEHYGNGSASKKIVRKIINEIKAEKKI